MKALLALSAAAFVLAGCSMQNELRQSKSPEPTLNGHSWPLDLEGHYAQGTTVLLGLVDEHGQMIESCVLLSSGNSSLDQAAVGMMINTRFNPQIKNGIPVRGYARIPVMLYVDGAEHQVPPLRGSCKTRPVERDRL